MTVGAKITKSVLPDELSPDKGFTWEIAIETVGDGADYIGGGVFKEPVPEGSHPLDRMVIILVDTATGEPVKVPPGVKASGSFDISPLDEWYTTQTGEPIPSTLEWATIVGRLEKISETEWALYETDRTGHEISVKSAGIFGKAWEFITAHPLELAAASGGIMIGAAVLARRK